MIDRVALGAGCAAVTAWATNAMTADNALASMSTDLFLALEFTAASVVLAFASAVQGSVSARHGDRGRMVPAGGARLRLRLRPAPFVVGLIGIVGTVTLQAAAFTYAPAVKANLLGYSWPLLVTLWCVATSRLTRPWPYLMVTTCGLAGVWLMLDSGATAEAAHDSRGYLFAAGSAICMAFYTVAAGYVRPTMTRSLLPAISTGAVLFLGVALARSTRWPSWGDLLQPIYLGCIPMAAGYTLWTYANARGQPARIAALGYLTPALSTIALVAVGVRATPSGGELLGITLVLICTAATGYLTRRSELTAH
jgi:drug/metabolite transporter (DMT)-like permease